MRKQFTQKSLICSFPCEKVFPFIFPEEDFRVVEEAPPLSLARPSCGDLPSHSKSTVTSGADQVDLRQILFRVPSEGDVESIRVTTGRTFIQLVLSLNIDDLFLGTHFHKILLSLPGNFSKSASVHQKQPPANVAFFRFESFSLMSFFIPC